MYEIFTGILNMSLTAGIIILAVMLLRIVLKGVPKKFICILWAFVAIRLICPFGISSSLSLFNLLDAGTDTASRIEYFQYNENTEKPEAAFQVPALGDDNASPESMTIGTRTSRVYLPVLMYIWLAGAAIMLMYALISFMRLKKEVTASVLKKDNVYICDEIQSPFILGVINPHIYIPSGLGQTVVENVIAHETAHLKRLDHWWKMLGFILLAIYWFNPLSWVAYILFCHDIEAACDEKVVKDFDKESRIGYSEALLSCAVHRRMITVCPLAFGENDVKGRVKRVLNYKKPAFWLSTLAVIACMCVAVVFLTNPSGKKSSGLFHDNMDDSTAQMWFDYNINPEQSALNGTKEIELPEYPGVTFRFSSEEVTAVTGNETIRLYGGMPVWSVYFCDMTGDGVPELCSELSLGSGIIDERIMVYDYANGVSYELSDRGKYDYYLRFEQNTGYLYVDKKLYDSDELVSSGRLIFKDGCIQIYNENAVTAVYEPGDGNFVKYYEMSDGTWRTDNCSYRYRLLITGNNGDADKESTFVYLSNIEDISYEQAFMAAGFSSNSDDYFDEKDAKFVGWK